MRSLEKVFILTASAVLICPATVYSFDAITVPAWWKVSPLTGLALGVLVVFITFFLYKKANYQIGRRTITEEALEYRIGLERIVNDISVSLMGVSSEYQFYSVVKHALERVGVFACVDRTYLFLLTDDSAIMHNIHEWCADGIKPRKDKLANLPAESFPWLIEKLKADEEIFISGLDDFPPEAKNEKEMFETWETKAMIAVPIITRNMLLGFIGFDFVKQPWMDEDIELLKTLSNLMGSAVYRMRTERALLEREGKLLDYRDRLKSLVMELSLTEERARRKVAKDLHDQLGQMLAVVKIKQEKLGETLVDQEDKSMSEEIVEMLDQILSDVRSLTFELSVLAVYRDDLNAAIEGLGARILAEHGIEFSFSVHGDAVQVSERIRTILCQIVRELFYNVIKHAEASKVETVLTWSRAMVEVVVADNGKGFDAENGMDHSKSGHFGLFNSQERIDLIGGKFTIHSTPESGTQVKISIPITATWA